MPVSTTIKPSKSTSATLRPQPPAKKKRIVRRRGRAQGGIDSDEEFEREARSDSDSDQDDNSSVDSSDDSETEPASDDVPTTSTSQPKVDVVEPRSTSHTPHPPDVNGISVTKASSALLAASTDWSEMVANEALDANGDAELPVIDFEDMDHHATASSSRPSRARVTTDHASDTALAPEQDDAVPEDEDEDHEAGPSTTTPRSRGRGGAPPFRAYGQSARQAYQERLHKDPSYVPVVGEFWGHDDRLLDKGLRSLSNWWRGRWQGRGRGRGGFDGGFGPRGRGRGGFVNGARQQEAGEVLEAELPPVERQWTHDGFEEMKKREERRAAPPPPIMAQRGAFRGSARGVRGGFMNNRGRGLATRVSFSPAASFDGSPNSRFPPKTSLPPVDPSSTRIWYAMKPEKPFTQRADQYLFFDNSFKPRGRGRGYRIKMPGRDASVVMAQRPAPRAPSPTPPEEDKEAGVQFAYNVRLPPRSTLQPVAAETPAPLTQETKTEPEPTATQESSQESVAAAKLSMPPSRSSPSLPTPSSMKPSPAAVPATIPPEEPSQPEPEPQYEPEPPVEAPPQDKVPSRSSSADGWIYAPPPDSIPPAISPVAEHPVPPILPPIQTVFSPVGHTPSPGIPYNNSPYSYPPTLPYHPAPPPGLMLDQNGIPYEYAPAGPVYYQPAPMPPPHPHHAHHVSHHSIYAAPPGLPAPAPMPPRTVMHPQMTFVPQHFRHHSTVTVSPSPDFMAPAPQQQFEQPSFSPPAPPLGEIFTPPRQSSRIEIRKPGEVNGHSHGGESSRADVVSPRGPSHLRSSVVANDADVTTTTNGTEVEVPASNGAPKTPAELVKAPEFVPRHSHSQSASQSFSYAPQPQHAQEYYPPPGLPPLPTHAQPMMNGEDQHQQHQQPMTPMYNPYAAQPQQPQYYYPAPVPGQDGYGYDPQQGYEGYGYVQEVPESYGHLGMYDPRAGAEMHATGTYDGYGGQLHGGTVYYT